MPAAQYPNLDGYNLTFCSQILVLFFCSLKMVPLIILNFMLEDILVAVAFEVEPDFGLDLITAIDTTLGAEDVPFYPKEM